MKLFVLHMALNKQGQRKSILLSYVTLIIVVLKEVTLDYALYLLVHLTA